MSRQATIRNLRWRGITVTNTLKVCLMIIGCVWILYQFKYSHQKKKTYEGKFSKVSLDDRSSPSIPEFRKQNLSHSNKSHLREFNHNQSTEGDSKNGGIEELSGDASRAAREDSLKGDDASSEVVAAKHGDHLTAAQDSSARTVESKYGEIFDSPRANTSKPLDISENNNSEIVPKGNQTLLIALNKTSSQANLRRRNKSDRNSTTADNALTRRSKPTINALNDAPLQTAK